MKALLVIGLFLGAVVLTVVGMFWLMAAATPDQSALSQEVEVTVLGAREEVRNSSSNRHGYRVEYAYRVGGTTYVADQFVPRRNWKVGLPLQACVDPGSPAEHALRLPYDRRCGGRYVGEQQTAAPVEGR